jgi:hypothetical protein
MFCKTLNHNLGGMLLRLVVNGLRFAVCSPPKRRLSLRGHVDFANPLA